jgi:predicted ArsR family transcriptional regulator
MSRPPDPKTTQALEALLEQPMTARDLCLRLGLPERTVKNICHRLVSRGQVQVVRRQRIPQARRPVACYGKSTASTIFDHGVSALWR